MKTLQSHSVDGALIQLHQADDGHHALYVQEKNGHDASAPIGAEILRSMLSIVDAKPQASILVALARDWSPDACCLIERIRDTMHAIAEHKNAAERTALLDVLAAHMRSAPGVRRVA